MSDNINFISVPIIVVCSYIIGEIYKVLFKKQSKAYKLIPILVALFGGILGVVIYYTEPSIMFGISDIYNAMLIGIISGFSSTGANQVVKQLFIKGD